MYEEMKSTFSYILAFLLGATVCFAIGSLFVDKQLESYKFLIDETKKTTHQMYQFRHAQEAEKIVSSLNTQIRYLNCEAQNEIDLDILNTKLITAIYLGSEKFLSQDTHENTFMSSVMVYAQGVKNSNPSLDTIKKAALHYCKQNMPLDCEVFNELVTSFENVCT